MYRDTPVRELLPSDQPKGNVEPCFLPWQCSADTPVRETPTSDQPNGEGERAYFPLVSSRGSASASSFRSDISN